MADPVCYRGDMVVYPRLALALGLLASLPALARAQCTSPKCTDVDAVTNVRAVVAAACDCSGAKNHIQYVKCAKQVLKSAIAGGTLQRQCKGSIMQCESHSTCGKKASICCVKSPKGKVKALTVKGSACPSSGALCDHPGSLADACTTDGACTRRQGIRSFKSVQQVLGTSCALPSCHSTIARQGGLVLESEDVSYKSLVNHPAELTEAAGRLRVKPGDPDNSFLIQKLRGQGPGLAMPNSGVPLPDPIIQMIADWIQRGAKTTAEECASPSPGAQSLCDDDPTVGGDYHWEPLPALDPPAPTDGIQLHVPPRNVDPGKEWEMCYAFRPGRDMVTTTAGSEVFSWTGIASAVGLPSGLPVIRQQVYRMHPGSHHLLLYAYFGAHPEVYPQGYFPCVAANCINDSDCPSDSGQFTIPIGGTQVAGTKYEVDYPEGVGIPTLTDSTVLIVNPHFTNPFQPPQETYGEAWLNLSFYKPGEFKAVLDGIFAINFSDLFVEPYQTRTISRIWTPRSILGGGATDAAIFQLFGHMHKRATEFQIDYVRGGSCSTDGKVCGRDSDCKSGQTCVRVPGAEDTTIYYTTEWDLAPIMNFQKPYFLVNHDEGLRWTCTHTNGIQGDPAHPPKECAPGCAACGYDAASNTCIFTRGVELGFDTAPRTYNVGDPMPLVFGQLADDDMCNMFGYFIHQSDLSKLP
jgi:hypothetical protein